MISSIEDYRFVNQESLNGIEINGEIMPFRNGYCDGIVDANGNKIEKKNILRGEDISFIAEASAEKCGFWKTCSYINGTDSEGNDSYFKDYNGSIVEGFDFKKWLSKGQISDPGAMNYYRWDFFNKLKTTSFNLQAPFGFRKMPSSKCFVLGDGIESYTKSSIFKEVMFDSGNMLTLSDCESYSSSTYPKILERKYVESMFNDISKVKFCMPSYSSVIIPSENVYEEGTVSGTNDCFEIYSNTLGISYGGCRNKKVVSIEINEQNGDVASKYEMWAFGEAYWNHNSPSQTIRKGLMMKMCDGVKVRNNGSLYVDFYLTVLKSDIDSILTLCEMPIPSITTHGTTVFVWEPFFAVFAKFTDRTTFDLV